MTGNLEVRVINLEEGMPFVKDAEIIFEQELMRAKAAKIKVLKLIHGYGSTGSGGKIKTAIIKLLEEKKRKKIIKDFIPGDKWDIFEQRCRSVLDVCPGLSKDNDLGRCNLGITIVLI